MPAFELTVSTSTRMIIFTSHALKTVDCLNMFIACLTRLCLHLLHLDIDERGMQSNPLLLMNSNRPGHVRSIPDSIPPNPSEFNPNLEQNLHLLHPCRLLRLLFLILNRVPRQSLRENTHHQCLVLLLLPLHVTIPLHQIPVRHVPRMKILLLIYLHLN